MTALSNDEEIYEPLYPYSQHKRGETIRYRTPGFDGIYHGLGLWVQGPGDQAAGITSSE